MKAKKSILAMACSMVAFTAAPQARADDGITIGMAVAQTGWMEAYDGEAYKMAQLWVDQQNAKGGLLGKPIKVVSGDTKTDRVEGAIEGQKRHDARSKTVVGQQRMTTEIGLFVSMQIGRAVGCANGTI